MLPKWFGEKAKKKKKEKGNKKANPACTAIEADFETLIVSLLKGRQTDEAYSHGCVSNKSHVLFVPGGRFANRKNVLLITDGQSNVDQHLTKPNADKLKAFGVHIYVFAVGSYISGIGEMVQVAGSSSSSKPDGYLFRVTDYGALAKFSELLVKKVASTGKYISISPDPSPC